jgi:pimeloyl-ACP methyl ester carboxylesterase
VNGEEPFSVPVGDGVLAGHRGGDGPPALILHGGPAWPDYTEGLAAELVGLVRTHRYTQRGARPSTVGEPFTIETHMDDAIAVLDHFAIERAWIVGHSWGGHLALHLLVAHPDRLLGIVCIDPLGAFDRVFAEFGANLRRTLSRDEVARVEEIEESRRRGEVTEADLVERSKLVWPRYFADPEAAPPHPAGQIGVACSTGTNASISDHFGRFTLATGLPSARLPALFVHGERDPLPVSSSLEAAALIPDARVETIPDCGHFPWMERPGEIRKAVGRFLPGPA